MGGLSVVVFCLISAATTIGIAWAEPGQNLGAVDSKQIEGSWVRTDGGYILQLKDTKADGSLTATYFNPRPINVSRAEVMRKEGALTLFVELRDVNYPGSTYTLNYDPNTDNLNGNYFQAAIQKTFAVEFIRAK